MCPCEPIFTVMWLGPLILNECVLQVHVGSSWMCDTVVSPLGGGALVQSKGIFHVVGFCPCAPFLAYGYWFYGKFNAVGSEMSTVRGLDGRRMFRLAGDHTSYSHKHYRKKKVDGIEEVVPSAEADPAHTIGIETIFCEPELGEKGWVMQSTRIEMLNILDTKKAPVVVHHECTPSPAFLHVSVGGQPDHYRYRFCYDNCKPKGGDSGGLVQKVKMSCAQTLEMSGGPIRSNPWMMDMFVSVAILPAVALWWRNHVRNMEWVDDDMNGPVLRLNTVPWPVYAALTLVQGSVSSYNASACEWRCDYANTKLFGECLGTIITKCNVGHRWGQEGIEEVVWVQMVWEMGSSDVVFRVFRRLVYPVVQ